LYVGDERLKEIPVIDTATLRLGVAGPEISFEVERPRPVLTTPTAPPPDSTAVYEARYFQTPGKGEPVGEHTQMVRRAFQKVQKKQKRKYHGLVAVLLLAIIGIGGYA